MDREEKAILWLDNFDFMTYKKKQDLLKFVGKASNLLQKDFVTKYSNAITNIVGSENYDEMIKNVGENFADEVLEKLNKMKVDFITLISPLYPETLKNIDTPPFVIYYKGDIKLLSSACFAVVGTRHITNYGKMASEKFTKGLVRAKFTIVSGLASGVDTVSLETALDCGGKTIGVLAGGIDKIYPQQNTNLARRMVLGGGLIMSEVKPKRKAEPYMFPIRNRIIAALSRGVLIPEAQEKSGSLHTKNYALDYGRDVFCVPGDIFSIASSGTNRCISLGHAKLVTKIEDILEEYNIKLAEEEIKNSNVSSEDQMIIDLLKSGEKTFQEIVERTGLEVRKVNSLLTMMTIRGIIKKLAGNVYFLNLT